MSERVRLDIALERAGLVPSRARARDAIGRGTVRVNGLPAAKPGQMVRAADRLDIDDPAAGYVSRAALKLIAGLDAGKISVAGKVCLDLGASTGGFSQVLAERGARAIYAVDVGHGQLHPDIAALPNLIALEGVNARDIDANIIPDAIDLLVCDVSFVSLTKVLGPPLSLCAPDAQAVLLIKPQFEVGRDHIGKGGIVREGAPVDAAIQSVIGFMGEAGWSVLSQNASPLAGGDGNTEFVAAFARE